MDKLKVDERYAIGKDSTSWVIYRLRQRSGRPQWEASNYYPTARLMIEGLLNKGLVLPANLSDLPKALDDWGTKIINTLAGMK